MNIRIVSTAATTVIGIGIIATTIVVTLNSENKAEQQIRKKSSNRIEVNDTEQAFYACVDAFVYGYDMSYKTDSFGYKKTLDATIATKETNSSTAKTFFDQKIQEDCLTQGTAVQKTNPKISDELFDSYIIDQDFWLKQGSLPTSKQQRALNGLNASQLNCIKEISNKFIIKSNTHFTYSGKSKSINEFETLFISSSKSCGAPEEKLKQILETYTLDENSNKKAVVYFYFLSYLTTNLSNRQILFQKIKVMEWKPNNTTCDDFSSHINNVLNKTHLTLSKVLYIDTTLYDNKSSFKDAGIQKIKQYNTCTPQLPSETTQNLESLFNQFYVEGKGLTQLTRTLRHKISTQQERRDETRAQIKNSNTTASTTKHFYRSLQSTYQQPKNPISQCHQKYCLQFLSSFSMDVWFDQKNIPTFALWTSKKNDIMLGQPSGQTQINEETLIDIELFIEDYVHM